MTIHLTTKKGNSVVDIEIIDKDEYVDIHSSVVLYEYSKILLNSDKKQVVIDDFSYLNEMRGRTWEYFEKKLGTKATFDDVRKYIRLVLGGVADRYGLEIIED